MKLDRKQSFGTIAGEAGCAVYEQNGRLFDLEENEIVSDEAPAAPAAKPKAKPKAADQVEAPAAPADPVDEQLAAQGAV